MKAYIPLALLTILAACSVSLQQGDRGVHLSPHGMSIAAGEIVHDLDLTFRHDSTEVLDDLLFVLSGLGYGVLTNKADPLVVTTDIVTVNDPDLGTQQYRLLIRAIDEHAFKVKIDPDYSGSAGLGISQGIHRRHYILITDPLISAMDSRGFDLVGGADIRRR